MRQEIKRNHCSNGEGYTKFYDNQASNAGLSSMRKGSRLKPINWAVKEILNTKEAPCDVLDIGCQHGIVELILATLWYDVTAIDVAQKYVDRSKANTEVVNDYINYKVLPVEKINSLNKTFQAIVCLSVLEHVKDFDVAMASMLDVADEGALMLFLVPLGRSWMSEEHTRVFTDDNVYDYFPKDSVISKIKFSDDPNMAGWYAVKYIKK